MAVILYKNADKTVATVAERNAIAYKVDNMVVTVIDAIADINAGSGVATYRWSAYLSQWILISREITERLNFETEELTIASGAVTASNIPTDNQIWDIAILDGDVIMANPRLEDLTVSLGVISGLDSFNGYSLRFTYAYGSITSQISTYIDEKVAEIVTSVATVDTGTISDFEGAL